MSIFPTIFRPGLAVYWLAFSLFGLSCNSYLFGGHKPILSDCCSFNTKTLELKLTCKNESLLVVKSFIVGASTHEEYNRLWIFTRQYDPFIHSVIIPVPLDSQVRGKSILIKVWKANQVINDYQFQVEPADWSSGKLLFGEITVR